ncbi:hypothetical protein GCM10023195_01700 [Actinoallomurus liliacearum]|uniref:Uncharacterized protein n=1 Tax=Actinoallomurus liliacearum TaxID=1080073 RepID=A0ABP8T8S8_9ACTN
MVDAVTRRFEHFLSWTVGALVELVNLYLADAESDHRLCPELGPYIRYGVSDPSALSLMMQGLRSWRLAHEIAQQIPEDDQPGGTDPREWLATMTISEWRQRFTASTSEILDLLGLTRTRHRSLLRNLLENTTTRIDINLENSVPDTNADPLSLAPVPGSPEPAPIGIFSGTRLIGTVRSADHADVSTILDTGLELDFDLIGASLAISAPDQ